MSSCKVSIMVIFLTLVMMASIPASAKTFYEDFEQTYGDQLLQLLDNGQHFTLTQDKDSGAGFKSKNEYLFGRFDMDMKLASGNSADGWWITLPLGFSRTSKQSFPYPHSKPMRVYCSFWNADDWATQGGKVKADWSQGSKTVSYKNYNINACMSWQQDCATSNTDPKSWQNYDIGEAGHDRLRWVQEKIRVSNYCADKGRFPEGLPRECMHAEFESPAGAIQPANPPAGAVPTNPPGANPANPPGANPSKNSLKSSTAKANPAHPRRPHHPVNPAIPNPAKPAAPNPPANPAIPKPANPAVPNPANPAIPKPANPTVPNPANPANIPNPANPDGPANPAVPNPANPAIPNPVHPAIPNPGNPPIPNPANPTGPTSNPTIPQPINIGINIDPRNPKRNLNI
ncbi:hypothetical protein ACLB2K_058755 [Fragaria x ananassa]